jgi:predicted dehydrogenase
VSLNPAFPFEEERRLIGKLRGRWIERVFPVIDEFALELDAFATAVQRGDNVEPDGEQGYRDVEIMSAIYESGRSGKAAAVNYGYD